MNYVGDFAVDATVNIYFSTNDSSGGRVEPSTAFEAADVRVYKNTSATQRSSEAGYTMTSPFDLMVGVQVLSIDTSDNTDAGFFAAGNDYTVILYPDETVDAQNISKVLGQFSIENRFMRGTDSALLAASAPTNFSSLGIESDGDLTKCNLVATTTLNTDMRGTDSALLAANVPTNFSSLGIESDGDITKVNTLDGHTAQTGDNYAIVSSVTFGNSALKTLIDALNDISSADILTTDLTEAYAGQGEARTLTEFLYELKSLLTQFTISGTLLTSKKIDGSTTAKTYTLDDATTPTGITETS